MGKCMIRMRMCKEKMLVEWKDGGRVRMVCRRGGSGDLSLWVGSDWVESRVAKERAGYNGLNVGWFEEFSGGSKAAKQFSGGSKDSTHSTSFKP